MYLGNLGNAYRLSGRTEQAIAAFKAYHARSPGFGLTDLVIIYQCGRVRRFEPGLCCKEPKLDYTFRAHAVPLVADEWRKSVQTPELRAFAASGALKIAVDHDGERRWRRTA